jgi:hypothetical protein
MKYTVCMTVMTGMTTRKYRGFIGIEAGIALAVLIALGLAALGGYKAYHESMTGHEAASSTPAATTTMAGGASASPAHPQPPLTGAGEVTATTSPFIVTSADSGKTIRLHKGDTFILKLGGSLDWGDVKITDNGVVTAVPTFAAIPGAQGMYEARAKGSATITATGAPICKANEACPQFIALFTATIVVD